MVSPVARARNWLERRVGWDAVLACQRLRSPLADVWFSHFPLLGNEIMFVLVIPWLIWFVDSAVARRFCLVAFAACAPCNIAKDVFRLPRPPPRLHVRGEHEMVKEQYGWPSGHSAINLSVAALLAAEAFAAGAAPLGLALALTMAHTAHVCFSRLYMGVHSAADIVGGLCIGTAVVLAFHLVGAAADAASVASAGGPLVALGLGVGVLALFPDKRDTNSAFTECVQFAGLHLGVCLATSPLGRAAPATPMAAGRESALLYAGGLIVLGVVRTICSTAAKALLALLPKRLAPIGVIFRKYSVSALAAVWVCSVHPAALQTVFTQWTGAR
jgi:membrane-associated phospholipid phosphatase